LSIFEHLMALGSFVLALGIAAILASLATLVHRRAEAKLYAPPLLWMGAIFLELINFWVGAFDYRSLDRASFVTIAFVVIYPTLVFLQAALVTPEAGGTMDLVAHHNRNYRFYVGIAAVCGVMGSVYFVWVNSAGAIGPVAPAAMIFPAVQAFVAVVALIWSGSRMQHVTAALALGLGIFNFFG
jgi:hypothetical protein